MTDPRPRKVAYLLLKRAGDFIAALVALVLLAPVLVLLAVWIRLDSPGPAVFCQQRAGQDGRPFTLLKFRTMRTDVEPFGHSPKSGSDPRLTRLGRRLRETSMDELPQFWNVLCGQMSLVGPRPLYVAQIAEWDETQRRRLRVKPGLTGLAQVSGRGALTREQKLALDVEYVDMAGVGTDLRILLATVRQVCGRRSVYEQRYSEEQETRGQE